MPLILGIVGHRVQGEDTGFGWGSRVMRHRVQGPTIFLCVCRNRSNTKKQQQTQMKPQRQAQPIQPTSSFFCLFMYAFVYVIIFEGLNTPAQPGPPTSTTQEGLATSCALFVLFFSFSFVVCSPLLVVLTLFSPGRNGF